MTVLIEDPLDHYLIKIERVDGSLRSRQLFVCALKRRRHEEGELVTGLSLVHFHQASTVKNRMLHSG